MTSSSVLALEKVLYMPYSIFNTIQPGKDGKPKFRLIFGPSHYITSVETMLGGNITRYFQERSDSSVFIGKTQREIRDKVSTYKDKYVYSFDYSKFDQCVPSFALLQAMDIIAMIHSRRRSNLLHVWKLISKYFVGGRFYHPFTGQYCRERGIASGSYFTNLAGSIANLYLATYVICSMKQFHKVHDILVHGDDLLLVTESPFDHQEFSRRLE